MCHSTSKCLEDQLHFPPPDLSSLGWIGIKTRSTFPLNHIEENHLFLRDNDRVNACLHVKSLQSTKARVEDGHEGLHSRANIPLLFWRDAEASRPGGIFSCQFSGSSQPGV